MGKLIKKLTFWVGLIFVLIIAGFPWWAPKVALFYLPDDWTVTKLDLGYPSLNGVMVIEAELDTPLMRVSLSGLKVDIKSMSATGKSLDVHFYQPEEQTDSQIFEKALNIPRVAIEQEIQKLSDVNLAFDVVNIFMHSQQWSLSNLVADIAPENQSHLSFLIQPNGYIQKASQVSANFKNNAIDTQAELYIEQEKLLSLNYRLTEKKQSLSGYLKLAPLTRFLIMLSTISEVALDGQLNFSLKQQNSSEKIISQFSYQGDVLTSLIGEQPLSLSLAVDSESNQLPFKVNIAGKGVLPQLVSLPGENLIQQASFNFDSQMIIEENNFFMIQPEVNFKANRVDLQGNKVTLKALDINAQSNDFSFADLLANRVTTSVQLGKTQAMIKTAEKNDLAFEMMGDFQIKGYEQLELDADLLLKKISIKDIYQSDQASLAIQLKSLHYPSLIGQATLSFEDDESSVGDFNYQKLTSELKSQISYDEVLVDGHIMLNNHMLTPLTIKFLPSTGVLSLKVKKHKLAIALVNQIIAQIAPEDLMMFKLSDGELIHQGEIVLNNTADENNSPKVQVHNKLALSKSAINFKDNNIKDANMQLSVESLQPLSASIDLDIAEVVLASGLKIEKVEANLSQLKDGTTLINDFSMKLLSGIFSGQKISLLAGKLAPSEVKVQGLSLTELLFFIELDNVFATGNIDLTLPFSTVNGAIDVTNARFKSREGGVIKYDSGDSAEIDNNIALLALKNFHYTQLDGRIDYNDGNGKYLIQIHLLGSNPDLYDGYPVDFTFNINGSLSGVFKSLFLTGSFEESIMQSVKTESQQQ